MIITTVMKNFKEAETAAKALAHSMNSQYVPRNKKSITSLLQKGEAVLVIGTERMELYSAPDEKPFFFHPNSAMFRIKRLLDGEHDPFVDAAGIEKGKTILDCTLGLASDSIVAAYAAGEEGKVCGIEGNKEMALIVGEGLKKWDAGNDEISKAMKRVEVVYADHLEFLQTCGDRSFDIVYFDPMFEEALSSEGMVPLKQIANYDDLRGEVIAQAKRVAKERVVLKDHWTSGRFEKWGFSQIKRRSASFHFGVIEKGD
ncbi:class I SAM-dependent methyltransferase [Metabacillus sp. KIGAM252]|uniref:Class I SAM-dependent methyltransferase n=1 Tax=Metabacillus flavus TaxID=2823519 RepID=A0ABS5LEZ4_9BACI|nr:class I SAM-dependent methyltransferase [Metabacillus flavus]